ncbi:transcription antitermination factor NusB [bacterium]|nr:transcription antitermination factor NusB [bacterium]
MRSRRAAREWALRILYASRLSGNSAQACFEDILREAKEDQNLILCRELVERISSDDACLDEWIRRSVEKWDLGRLAVIDLIILRMAIAEFLYFDDIPYKVTINEAIELAKRYSTTQSGRFVNGILDAVSVELKKTAGSAKSSAEVHPR